MVVKGKHHGGEEVWGSAPQLGLRRSVLESRAEMPLKYRGRRLPSPFGLIVSLLEP